MSDWRPIETAPHGVAVLIWDGDSFLVALFCGCKKQWLLAECENNTAHEDAPIECEPTHWMPLPKAPAKRRDPVAKAGGTS